MSWEPRTSFAARSPSDGEVDRAAELLAAAIDRERAGSMEEAIEGYRSAISNAERLADRRTQSEAMRRLSIQHHHRGEREEALRLSQQSYAIANEIGDDVLAGEALNVLGQLHLRPLRAGGDLFDRGR